jgi:hypothetical protein
MVYIPSTYKTRYDISNIFPEADVTTGPDVLARPGQRTLIPDFLDQGYQNILDGVRFWSMDTWVGGKWTTMVYRHHGTTSTWMLCLAFNGLTSPMQLQSGMRLRFPAISEINRLMAVNTTTSGIGQTITIGPANIVGQP